MPKEMLLTIVLGLVMIPGSVFAEEEALRWEKVGSAGIPGHNIVILTNASLTEAKRRCIAGGFKSFDYESRSNRVYLQDVNMDTHKLKKDYKDNPYDHYTLRRPSKTIGIVRATTGDVWYGLNIKDLQKNPQHMKSGDPIKENYFIKTSKAGRAVLQFGDGLAQASVGSDSVFNIRMYNEKVIERGKPGPKQVVQCIFNLVKGNVRALTGALFGKGDRLCVKTKNSTCGCRGTDFLVRHDEATGVDVVLVRDGVVDVTGRKSGEAIIHAGEQVQVRNGIPEQVEPLDQDLWQQLAAEEPTGSGGKATATHEEIRH